MTGVRKPCAYLVLGFLLVRSNFAILEGRKSSDDCSGHGYRAENGTCICDNSWPDSSEKGYIGEDCQLPVFAGSLSGADMTSPESRALEEGAWACHTVPLGQDRNWNYVSILLNRTSGEGDPDFYAYCPGGSPAPFINATAYPPTGFTFQDVSAGHKPLIIRTESKSEFPEGTFAENCWFCIHNYGIGKISYALAAHASACPNGFSARTGRATMCHTPLDAAEPERRFSQCSDEGKCKCRPPWSVPPNIPEADLFPGLGFRDCSAGIINVPNNTTQNVAFIVQGDLEPRQWQFYAFNISEDDFEIRIAAAEQIGRVEVFAKAEVPPGNEPAQFDARAAWNPSPDPRKREVVLTAERKGLWFAGVWATSPLEVASFEFVLQRNACPANCSSSSQGTCDARAHQCTCMEGFAGNDCSQYYRNLEFNQTLTSLNSSTAEYSFFSMPEPTEAILHGNSEVIIAANVSSAVWNDHVQVRPELLLLMDGRDAFPSAENFTYRLSLDLEKLHTLSLCPSQIARGAWKAALYNPSLLALNFSLSIDKLGKCLNDCSDKGTCSGDGVCQCQDGWAGGDCSVDLSSIKPRGSHHHFFGSLLGVLFWLAVGGGSVLLYVSRKGIPAWMPLQNPNYGLGIYQELTENEGI